MSESTTSNTETAPGVSQLTDPVNSVVPENDKPETSSNSSPIASTSDSDENSERSVTNASQEPSRANTLMKMSEDLVPVLEFESKSKEQTLFQCTSINDQQRDLFNKILSRSSYGVETVDRLLKYFTERVNLAKKYSKLLGELPTIHREDGDVTTMETALNYIERISSSEIEGNNQLISNLETAVIKPLQSLHSELLSNHKSMQSKVQSLLKSLDSQYERLSKNLSQFENILKETQQNWMKGSEISKDPWAEKVNCHLAVKNISTIQQECNGQLEELFKEMERIELKRVEKTQPLLAEYVLIQKNISTKIAKDRDIASNAISAIKFGIDNEVFLQTVFATTSTVTSSSSTTTSIVPSTPSTTANPPSTTKPRSSSTSNSSSSIIKRRNFTELLPQPLMNYNSNSNNNNNNNSSSSSSIAPSLVTTGTVVSYISDPMKAKSVVCCGELELDGLIKWKKYTFVLTKFGFLHYYNKKLELERSIPLQFCTLVENVDPNNNNNKNGYIVFQLNHNTGGFFNSSKSYLIRSSNSKEVQEWISNLKQYVSKTG